MPLFLSGKETKVFLLLSSEKKASKETSFYVHFCIFLSTKEAKIIVHFSRFLAKKETERNEPKRRKENFAPFLPRKEAKRGFGAVIHHRGQLLSATLVPTETIF